MPCSLTTAPDPQIPFWPGHMTASSGLGVWKVNVNVDVKHLRTVPNSSPTRDAKEFHL